MTNLRSGARPGTLSTTANAAGQGTAYASDNFGPVLFVNTVAGADYYSGLTPAQPLATMQAAFDLLALWHAGVAKSADNAVIEWIGDIREQLTAPLGVTGVTIRSRQGGNNRHDNGDRWRQAATAGDAPLLTLREQGWVIDGGTFVPQAAYSAIRLRRQEDATYPDASHAEIRNARFIGNEATPAGIGLEDYGGNSHYRVTGCEFSGLVTAYSVTNQGIDIPNHNYFGGNVFFANTNDFVGAQYYSVIENNQFLTVSTTTINTISGQTATAAKSNNVVGNYLPDADPNNTNGYTGSTTDSWSNWCLGVAARVAESPPGAS